jgi:hypothetical protein
VVYHLAFAGVNLMSMAEGQIIRWSKTTSLLYFVPIGD